MGSGFIIENGKLIRPVGEGMPHVVIPDDVEVIGEYAFSNLHDIESVILHDRVKKIGDGAFENCHGLRNIVIPNSETRIGKNAFEACRELNLTYGNLSIVIDREEFSRRAEERIPYDLNYLAEQGEALFGAGNPERIAAFKRDIAEGSRESTEFCAASIVTVDNLRPHRNADRLQCTVIHGRNVIVDDTCRIGQKLVCFPLGVVIDREFAEENHLLRRMGSGGTHIEGYLHPKKRGVVPVWIRGERSDGLALPVEVLRKYTDIERLRAGDRFYSLNSHEICRFYFPDSMEVRFVYRDLKRYYESSDPPETVIIPWGIRDICSRAFSYCRMEKVVLPGSLHRIDEAAFCMCENLKEIIIPDSVTDIGYEAFYGCRSLAHIELPGSVRVIGYHAFKGCPGIKNVQLKKNARSGSF